MPMISKTYCKIRGHSFLFFSQLKVNESIVKTRASNIFAITHSFN